MIIKVICACDSHGGIGKNNKLPWCIKEDLDFFRNTTRGHSVVMGMKTYESIGSILPYRNNYILSKNTKIFIKDATMVYNEVDIKMLVNKYSNSSKILYVIGGVSIYKIFDGIADEIILSVIERRYNCDRFINLNALNNYKINKKQFLINNQNININIYFLDKMQKQSYGNKNISSLFS